jgi:hypothetical protein
MDVDIIAEGCENLATPQPLRGVWRYLHPSRRSLRSALANSLIGVGSELYN